MLVLSPHKQMSYQLEKIHMLKIVVLDVTIVEKLVQAINN